MLFFHIDLASGDSVEAIEKPSKGSRLKKERKVEYRSIAGSTMQITFGHKGSYSVPIFDWGFGPKTAGSLLHQMPFDQPSWPSGKGRGRIASWQASNEFSSNPESFAPKAVYEGPGFRVANYILSVEWEGESYKVDFTDKLPTFSSFQK